MKSITLLVALCAVPWIAFSADPNADNTEKNERDRSGETLTPIDQSNDPADLKITANTRKALMDSSLSSDAKNCKIITTSGGAVTLRGPVASGKEKSAIEKMAKDSGATGVTNQLEVKQPK